MIKNNNEIFKILYIEDNEHDRFTFRKIFEKSALSCSITECVRAEDGISLVEENPTAFDLVVVDYNLPGLDGLDFCYFMKEKRIMLPVVILTGSGSEQVAVEALKSGAEDYLIKDPDRGYLPLLPIVLPEVVRKYSDRLKRIEAEKQIEQSLKEKEILLKEIHHRVKNNFSIIASLISLQENNITDLETKELLTTMQNRILTMSMIHEQLYQSNDIKTIDFAEYAATISEKLFYTYVRNPSLIKVNTDLDTILLPIKQAIPCGLILNELLTNAFKYAFPDAQDGKSRVFISLKQFSDSIEIIVRDNGIGLPGCINIEDCDSMGLTLVNVLAEQLDGTLNINREDGTSVSVLFAKEP